MLLSIYSLFMFCIHVVKSERNSFVLVSRRASGDEMSLFDLEDAQTEEGGPKARFDTASAAPPQATSTFETEPRAFDVHNGSITFLYLAFSPVFRILHKNGFAGPARQVRLT